MRRHMLVVGAALGCLQLGIEAQTGPTQAGSISAADDLQVNTKAGDLLRQMTLEEKVAQLSQLPGFPVPQFKQNVQETPEQIIQRLGTQGGNAVADVLFGDVNPAGHLPVSWPRNTGQAPIYYSHNLTQLPETAPDFNSRYWDAESTPLYPFGYGLSYTTSPWTTWKLAQRRRASELPWSSPSSSTSGWAKTRPPPTCMASFG